LRIPPNAKLDEKNFNCRSWASAASRNLNAETAKLAELFIVIFLAAFAVKFFPNINKIFAKKNEDLTCNTIK